MVAPEEAAAAARFGFLVRPPCGRVRGSDDGWFVASARGTNRTNGASSREARGRVRWRRRLGFYRVWGSLAASASTGNGGANGGLESGIERGREGRW